MFAYMSSSFIDYEKGTCSFDSPEFIQLLEFANRFPDADDAIDWETATDDEMEQYWNESETAYLNDKALLNQVYMSDFREYARERTAIFNDDITLVGAPSTAATEQRSALEHLSLYFRIPPQRTIAGNLSSHSLPRITTQA